MPPRRINGARRFPPRPSNAASLAKIVEETNAAAKALGELTSERDALKSEITTLHNEKTVLQKEIGAAHLTLDNLRAEAHRASQAHLALDTEHATKKGAYTVAIKHLEATGEQLRAELSGLEPLKKELIELRATKASLSRELSGLESKIIFTREEQRIELEAAEQKRAELRREIAAVDERIAKNGTLAQALESDRAKLEIYVRRLQRYYDETGIKLSILPEFGLTHYGETK
jgi:chromosome segregation ATPase